MQTLAILPVKQFRRAKQRMSSEYGMGSRSALARAMLSDVLAALRRSHEINDITVITSDREAADLAEATGASVQHEVEETGHREAVRPAIDRATALGYNRVLLVPADCPLTNPDEIDDLLNRSADAGIQAAIVPDRHEAGTNALLLSPPTALEPQFGPESLRRHLGQAEQRAISHRVEYINSLELDVDTPEDLAELCKRLESWHGGAPSTRGVIHQLRRLRQSAAPVA